MLQTLYDKLWSSHVVHQEDDGTALLYMPGILPMYVRLSDAGGMNMKGVKLIAAMVAVLILSACNTVQGIGKDIEKGGEAIQKATK